MKALFVRPKEIKDVVIFRDKDHNILRVHVNDWNMDVERAHCADKQECKRLVELYKTLTDAIKGNADFVEVFNPEPEDK